MIDLSLALCVDLLKCRLLLTGIEMAKFTNPILPDDLVEAEVSVVENNGT
jgi:3-hydroxymyristoyl/3-hydroxydecanoyl-(acyl carrier protein) dehydratase